LAVLAPPALFTMLEGDTTGGTNDAAAAETAEFTPADILFSGALVSALASAALAEEVRGNAVRAGLVPILDTVETTEGDRPDAWVFIVMPEEIPLLDDVAFTCNNAPLARSNASSDNEAKIALFSRRPAKRLIL